MSLVERIAGDLTSALKAGDAEQVGVLRLITAEFQKKEIENRGRGVRAPLADDEVVAILRRESKKRQEAAELYRRGGREDRAFAEDRERERIAAYLPAQLPREAIVAAVDEIIAGGARGFSDVMRAAAEKLKGRADGRVIQEIVKEKTAGA